MKNKVFRIICLAVTALFICSSTGLAQESIRFEIRYRGRWEIQPNGDVHVEQTYTIPAGIYANWKENNMHMKEMRGYHPSVSPFKVDDLNYKWDDVQRTLTFTMTGRGLALNRGNYWEAVMTPGLTFSNIDKAKNTAFYHRVMVSPNITVSGQDIVVFPPEAEELQNIGDRAIRYVLPEPRMRAGGGGWWLLFAVSLAGGIGLLRIPDKPAESA